MLASDCSTFVTKPESSPKKHFRREIARFQLTEGGGIGHFGVFGANSSLIRQTQMLGGSHWGY